MNMKDKSERLRLNALVRFFFLLASSGVTELWSSADMALLHRWSDSVEAVLGELT